MSEYSEVSRHNIWKPKVTSTDVLICPTNSVKGKTKQILTAESETGECLAFLVEKWHQLNNY